MALRERLESVQSESQLQEAVKRATHPTGWEPGIVWEPGKGGTITAGPMATPPDPAIWNTLIADWGIDPTITEIVDGSVQIRGWDAIRDGEVVRMKYYRATLRAARSIADSARIHMEELYKEVRKAKPGRMAKADKGGMTLLVCLSDFQTGNPDDLGVEGQISALARLVDSLPERLKSLRKAGYVITCVCVAGLGDLIEGTCGFYAAQQFRVELDRREQVKLVRRALRDILMALAPLVEEVKVVCVPGNHGENRQNGKSITRVGDNDDVAVFEQVAEILSINPEAYGHIKWRIPSDEIAVAVELSGVRVGFTHGHVAKMKGNAAETIWGWWEKQAMGRAYESIADAEILIAGHFHHLNVKEQQGRSVFVCPSLTNVSEYYSDATGVNTRPGTLTMLVGDGGWTELAVI